MRDQRTALHVCCSVAFKHAPIRAQSLEIPGSGRGEALLHIADTDG
jgi:hypothetical protein